MAARLQGAFYSEKGTLYIIQVGDSDHVGGVTDFECTDARLSWETDGEEDNRFAPIMVSQFSFRLVVKNSTLQTFVDDLVAAVEGRFTVTLTNLSGFSNTLAWNGYVLTDLVRIEDVPLAIGYQLEIKAKDGLNRLRNIEYSNAGSPYSGFDTFLGHAFRCLGKLTDITAQYTTQTFLSILCTWNPDIYTYSASANPLKRTRVNHKAFYYVDTRGNYVFRSCFDVLKDICKAWGMRLSASGDAFWMWQLNALTDAASTTVFEYQKNQTENVATSQDLTIAHDQNDPASPLFRYSGGAFEFFAPLRRVQVDYAHIATRNFPEIAGQVWTESAQPSITIENIDSNAGVAIFRLTGTLQVTANQLSTFTLPYHLLFLFTLKVGDDYLRRDLTFTGSSYEYGATFWDGSLQYYRYLLPRPIRRDPESVTYEIEIITPGIPTDDDLLFTFQFSSVRSVTDGSELNIIDYDIDYTFQNVYLEYIYDGTFASRNDINRYAAENDAEASRVIELETMIGDGPTVVSPGHIEALEDDDTTWTATAGNWKVKNTGTAKAFSQLLVNEIMRGQISPARKMDMRFQMRDAFNYPLVPHRPISYDSSIWVMQFGQFDIRTDQVRGIWYKLQSAGTFTEQAVQFLPRDGETGPPSSGGSPAGGGSGSVETGSTVTMFAENFTATGSSATFTVTENGGVLAGSTAQIIVFRNGQQISSAYIDSIDAPNGQLTLTFTPASGEEITLVWWVIV